MGKIERGLKKLTRAELIEIFKNGNIPQGSDYEALFNSIYLLDEGKYITGYTKQEIDDMIAPLNAMKDEGYVFAGIAHPGDPKKEHKAKVFYYATEVGEYKGFLDSGGQYIKKANYGVSVLKQVSAGVWEIEDVIVVAQELGEREDVGVSQNCVKKEVDKLNSFLQIPFNLDGMFDDSGNLVNKNNCKRTPLLNIVNGIELSAYDGVSEYPYRAVSFFNSNKEFISNYQFDSCGLQHIVLDSSNIPSNAKYVVIATLNKYLDRSFIIYPISKAYSDFYLGYQLVDKPHLEAINSLHPSIYANGNSSCSINQIRLKNIGDFIEFSVLPISVTDSQGYNFCGYGNGRISIGINCSKDLNNLAIRDSKGNWLLVGGDAHLDYRGFFNPSEFTKLKIEITSLGLDVYKNDSLFESISWVENSSKELIISNFFNAYNSFWNGYLRDIHIVHEGIDEGVKNTLVDFSDFENNGTIIAINTALSDSENRKLSKAYSTNVLIDKSDRYAVSLEKDIENSYISFGKKYYLNKADDYIEIVCANYSDILRSGNLAMVEGHRTLCGLYNNQFWLRSDSQSSSDYLRFDLPSNFDRTLFHTYKIEMRNDKDVEVFIDGISLGIKTTLGKFNVSIMSAFKSGDFSSRYDYKEVHIHSAIDGNLDWFVSELYSNSVNSKLISFEPLAESLIPKINSNTKGIDSLKEIFNSDSYYSAYNHVDGVESYTELENSFILDTIGDYVEIRSRYFGGNDSYKDKLSLLCSEYAPSGFGWYSSNQIYFRAAGEDYKKWSIDSKFRNFEWNVIKLVVVDGGFELFINGESQGVQPNNTTNGFSIIKVAYKNSGKNPQKYDIHYIKGNSSKSGILDIPQLALYKGSINVELKQAELQSDVELNPLCFVKYNGTDQFDVFVRDKQLQDIYYGFPIVLGNSRGTADDPIYFKKYWELTGMAYIYQYSKVGGMTSLNISLIYHGESEFVFKYLGKGDFTGGVHGDETIDIDPTDLVQFYLDGVKIDDISTPFELTPCNEFYYIEKSTFHNTAEKIENYDTKLPANGSGVLSILSNNNFAIDGVDTGLYACYQNTVYKNIEDASSQGVKLTKSDTNTWLISFIYKIDSTHKVVGNHWKRTIFSNNGYETYNTVSLNSDKEVDAMFSGICCLGKGVATIGHNENLIDATFVGDQGQELREKGTRLFEAYNPDTGTSARVESWLINGGGVLTDDMPNCYIWDRGYDSKYYRSFNNFTPKPNKKMSFKMEVRYNKH